MGLSFLQSQLRVGEVVEGDVLVVGPSPQLLLNIHGHFIRVENQSSEPIAVGNKIRLFVESIKPLKLRMMLSKSGHINHLV